MASPKREVLSEVNNTLEITEHSLTDETPAQDRRLYPRRGARWKASLTTLDKKVLPGTTQDVSARGACIITHQVIPDETKVLINIEAHYGGKKRPIRALGVVRHHRISRDGITLGILIKDAPKTALNFLERYSANQI